MKPGTVAAYRWFGDADLRPVAVVASRRIPYRVQPPARIVPPRGVKTLPRVPTPIFDRLAWERGHPLAAERPALADAMVGVVVAAGAR